MAKKILKFLGYCIAALFFLVIFLYVTFPFQRLKSYVEEYAKNRMQVDLAIGTYDHGLTTHTFRNVRVVFAPPPRPSGTDVGTPGALPTNEKNAKKSRTLKIKRLTVDVSLSKLLFKRTMSVRFNGALASGTLSGGLFSQSRTRRVVGVKQIKGLRLGQLPLTSMPVLSRFLPDGLLIDGRLGGGFSISHGASWQSLRGAIRLKLANAFVSLLRLKLGAMPMEIRDADLGQCEIEIETTTKAKAKLAVRGRAASDTVIYIRKLRCDGADLEIRVQDPSYIELARPLKSSTINVTLQFALGDHKAFVSKNPGVSEIKRTLKSQRKMTGDFFGLRLSGLLFGKITPRLVRPRVKGKITKSNTRPRVRFKPRPPPSGVINTGRFVRPPRLRVTSPKGMIIPRPTAPKRRPRRTIRLDTDRRPPELQPDTPEDGPGPIDRPKKDKKEEDDEGR